MARLSHILVVSAEDRGLGLKHLEGAVSQLDLAKLESMKDVGVEKSRRYVRVGVNGASRSSLTE